MSTLAVVMMIFSLVVVWGGLVVSIVYLRSHPSPYSDEDDLAAPEAPVHNSREIP